jgi:hypothetical protein
VTRAIKRRAEDGLRTGRFGHDPVCWLHEHLAGGGGNMVVLARKDLHGDRRPRAPIQVIDPAHLRATRQEREAFAPLRDALDNAARELDRAVAAASA